MKSRWTNIIAFGLIPMLILVSASWGRIQRTREYKRNGKEAFAKHNAETLAHWSTKAYTPLQDTNTVNKSLEGTLDANKNASQLSEDQKQSLVLQISTLFQAYSSGSYDAYRKLRFPSAVKWHWAKSVWNAGALQKPLTAEEELDRYFKNGPMFWSPQMLKSFRTNYGFYPKGEITRKAPDGMDARFREYVFQYSGCTFYSNFWTAVDFSDLRLMISHTNNTPAGLLSTHFYPQQTNKCATMPIFFPNLGYLASKEEGMTLVEFDNDIKSVARQCKHVLYADLFFFVKTCEAEGRPYPVAFRFYWSPDDHLWLGDELITGTIQTHLKHWCVF